MTVQYECPVQLFGLICDKRTKGRQHRVMNQYKSTYSWKTYIEKDSS